MTIEEIKEWREHKYHGVQTGILTIIDTLLAEVERLEKHNAYADQYNAVQDLHLAIAIEALERIATNPLVHSSNHQSEMRPDEIASTALDRIKESILIPLEAEKNKYRCPDCNTPLEESRGTYYCPACMLANIKGAKPCKNIKSA